MKTIRLYHPHTHEGIAYDPPPPALADASTTAPAADAPVADASLADMVTDAVPSRHDRRARVAVDLSSTEPAADTTARSA
jgi:hypothetical protein